MTDRQKLICDHIMHAITTAEGQTKFGLSGMTTLFDGKASDKEVAEAVQYLIDNNYLRMLGKYVFGTGVTGQVDEYDLTGFDPFLTLTKKPEKPDESLSADAYKGTQNSAKRPSLTQLNGKSKAAANADEEPEETSATDAQEKGAIEREIERQEQLNIDNIPTLFGIKEQARKEDSSNVFDAIERLKQQLKPEPVPNVALKLAVLSDLSKVLDPSIGTVLKEIQADYRNQLIH
jgi:hypothetical protein